MKSYTRLALGAGLAAALLAVPSRGIAQEYRLVAHADAGVTELSKPAASKLFLKQEKKLPSGIAAVPVDLAKTSAVRAAFTTAVHARAVGAVEQYWQQQLFSGRDTPPVAKPSDDEVLAFVKATPGAIGYVSASAALPAGVVAITLK